jgi:hypothetical protein
MIPPKAIKKIKNDAHREIVVGHLIAYGFFPSTSEGIDQAKKFVAGLDQWIAPSDLPNYYDDLESDLMTGRETAGIVNIRMILEDFYFGGGSGLSAQESEPESIPVEVEIVEVEQKEPDEPIVIQVEAPFENPTNPNKRRRIRAKRIKNTIKVNRQKKKDLATRMADAFDRNLEDLIDNIRNPKAPAPPKTRRKKKQVLVQKRAKKVAAKFDTKDPNKAATFNEFLGIKLKNAFGRAAEARRLAKESGAEPQGRGYFLKKALGFEFGGDKIARLKGTFSKNPAAVNDPALSRDQRFLAGIGSDITPPPVRQPELFDTSKYARTGVSKVFSDNLDRLKESFNKVEKRFNDVISIKKNKADNNDALSGMAKTVESLKNILKKNNKVQSDINKTKDKQLDFLQELAEETQAGLEEASIEETVDNSDVIKPSKPEFLKDKGGAGDDEDDDGGGGDDDGGGGGLFDFVDFFDRKKRKRRRRRRRGPRGRGPRGPKGGGPKKPGPLRRFKDFMGRGADKAKDVLSKGKNAGGKLLSKGKGLAAGTLAAGTGLLATANRGVKSFGDNALNIGKGAMNWFTDSPVAKRIGLASGKFGGRMVPGVGTAFSAADAADRASRGDKIGAWLAGTGAVSGAATVATSGAALTGWGALVPAATELTSAVADVALFGYDIFNAITGRDPGGQQREKLNAGGVVPAQIGEAGPEMLIRNGGATGGGMNPLQSLAPMIVALREVTKRAGTWADPIENMVRQVTDPIAKQLNLPVLPVDSKLGEVKAGAIKPEDEFGFFGKLFGFGRRGEDGEGDGSTTGSDNSTVPITGIPLGESQTAQAGQLVSGLVSRGFTKEEAAAIVGNLWAESGFRTGAVNPSSGAYGLMQWLGGRKNRLVQFAQEKGKSPADLDLQLDYIAWELKGGNPYETKQFEKAMAYGTSIADKTRGFAQEVERAGAHELASSMAKRVGAGESAFNAVAVAPPPGAAPPQQPNNLFLNPSPQQQTPSPLLPPAAPANPSLAILNMPAVSQPSGTSKPAPRPATPALFDWSKAVKDARLSNN